MRRKRDNDHDIAALFESGVALDSAWIEFSPDMDRFTLKALMTAPAQDDILQEEDPERYEQISKGWLPTTWESRQKKLELRTRDQRGHLLDNIYRGDLIAVGFRTLPDGFDELVRVPRQHFFVDYENENPFPEINWSKAECRIGDSSYFDIRIAKRPQGMQLSQDAPASTGDQASSQRKSTRGGGRPRTEDQIEQCVRDLLNDSKFQAMSRTEQVGEVRAKILGEKSRHASKHAGYSDSHIKRIIGTIANAGPSN